PPPAPVMRSAPAPTYAPGGHAITPTVSGPRPAPNTSIRPGGGQQNIGPTYAPGGHAIIPTVSSPTFSPSFQSGSNQSHPVSTAPSVGFVPPPTAGRLQLAPVAQSRISLPAPSTPTQATPTPTTSPASNPLRTTTYSSPPAPTLPYSTSY